MKFLFDIFPVALFFVAYKMYDIYVATAVAIVSSVLQVAWFWLKYRRIETMHIVTMILIIVFGGATLILQDEMFIKWKPTILNWAFAIAFIASQYIGRKPIIQRMLSSSMDLPNPIWIKLNILWALFFFALGLINIYVIYNFDTDTWVNFKLFGMTGLTFIFVIFQSLYISRYIKDDATT